MLYEVSWSAWDLMSIVILAAAVALAVLLRRSVKRSDSISGRDRRDMLIHIVHVGLIVFLVLLAVLSSGKKAMNIYTYRSGKCETVSGDVSNYRMIYRHRRTSPVDNKDTPLGSAFSVGGVEFEVRNELFHGSYHFDDSIITGNGQKFTIYYVSSVSGPVRDILRIDKG